MVKHAKENVKDIKKYSQDLINKGFNDLKEIKSELIIAKTFILHNKLDDAKDIIDYSLKTKNYEEIDFLEIVSYYFACKNKKLHKEKHLEIDIELKKDVKKYIKNIRKVLKVLERDFDDRYLLIVDYDKYYRVEKNLKILYSLDEITQILSLSGYEKDAKICFDIKSKLELGVQRYFLFERDNFMLFEFNHEGDYRCAKDFEISKLKEYYDIKIKIETKTEENDFMNFESFLYKLKEIKKQNRKKYEEEFIKNYNIIKNFPKLVLKLKDYKIREKIIKSINKDLQDNKVRLNKEKIVLIEPNYLDNIVLTLQILKDE
jgi:hypothetical protein